MTQESQSPSKVPSPKTTEVMVILTARQGVTRHQIINFMPAEIRATVSSISTARFANGTQEATAEA